MHSGPVGSTPTVSTSPVRLMAGRQSSKLEMRVQLPHGAPLHIWDFYRICERCLGESRTKALESLKVLTQALEILGRLLRHVLSGPRLSTAYQPAVPAHRRPVRRHHRLDHPRDRNRLGRAGVAGSTAQAATMLRDAPSALLSMRPNILKNLTLRRPAGPSRRVGAG